MNLMTKVSKYLNWFCMFAVVLMMMITVCDVFLRYAFKIPIPGAIEIVENSLIVAVLGTAIAAMEGRHIRMDTVIDHVPPKVQASLDAMNLALSFVIVFILVWTIFDASLNILARGLVTTTLRIPRYPFYIVLMLGFAGLGLSTIPLFFKEIARLKK